MNAPAFLKAPEYRGAWTVETFRCRACGTLTTSVIQFDRDGELSIDDDDVCEECMAAVVEAESEVCDG